MVQNEYQFALLMYRRDGTALGCASAQVDWEPAKEWTRFCFARRGDLPLGSNGIASISPLWNRTDGEPYLRGFRVHCDAPEGRPVSTDFPTSYFKELAAKASAEFVKRGKLEEGDDVLFQAVAYRRDGAGEAQTDPPALPVVEQPPSLPLSDADLAAFRNRSSASGIVDTDDMPVFVPRRVLEEAAALTRGAAGREAGGILIGKLLRDPALPELFVEVTAQVPAEDGPGTETRLTFTAQTWCAADAAIQLRGQAEVYLGYWHSHPVREWCRGKECTPEKLKDCKLARDFFSEDDRALLRAAFPRAYSLGLVVNDTAGGLTYSLFGWREARIYPRGFYLLEDNHA